MAPRAGPCPKAPRARAPPATTAAAFDDFLPIAERPEWASGVTPRPPPRTPQPVVAIERDELMGDLMDYFWGAVQAGERRWVKIWVGGRVAASWPAVARCSPLLPPLATLSTTCCHPCPPVRPPLASSASVYWR